MVEPIPKYGWEKTNASQGLIWRGRRDGTEVGEEKKADVTHLPPE